MKRHFPNLPPWLPDALVYGSVLFGVLIMVLT